MVDGYYYTYYPVAVHVKMVKDYVFELQGITQMTETVEAFREAYPENDYSDIPAFTGMPEEERDYVYETKTSGGVLEIRKKGQEKWETVPVTLEELLPEGMKWMEPLPGCRKAAISVMKLSRFLLTEEVLCCPLVWYFMMKQQVLTGAAW